MKADIADQLARPDLTSQIAAAITTAIDIYQSERFEFSESRSLLFTTAQAQEFYGPTTSPVAVPNVDTIMGFDYVVLYLGGTGGGTGAIPWLMNRVTHKEIELLNQNGLVQGQPYNWDYYNLQLRLGPIPDTAYTIRIAAHNAVAPPPDDVTAGNPWMVQAERLIRSRAKYELLLHVIRDFEEAEIMASAVRDAYEVLKGRTNRKLGRGEVIPMEF